MKYKLKREEFNEDLKDLITKYANLKDENWLFFLDKVYDLRQRLLAKEDKKECHCGKNGHALNSINCPVHGYTAILNKETMEQLDGLTLAQKEDKKECKHNWKLTPDTWGETCFYCGKQRKIKTTHSPLELPKINNNFSSMEQYNWAKQITDEVNKLYQLIKDKL